MSESQLQSITVQPLSFTNEINCQSLFSLFANQPWAMWLDSCDSIHQDSRFDIMVWQPEITLVTNDTTTSITCLSDDTTELSTEDPLTLLKTTQANFFAQYTLCSQTIDLDLPFNTGALGYFSYDLGRRFEQLPKQAKKDIAMPEMAVGLYNQAVIFDNTNKQYYLVCAEEKRSQLTALIQQAVNTHLLPLEVAPFQLSTPWHSNISQREYQAKFQQIQDYLLSGDCYQINLTQRFNSIYQGDEFDAYLALREANQAPFSAFLRFDNLAILSISPERFLRLKSEQVQSKPIKGTLPRGITPEEDRKHAQTLTSSVKDKAENLMIVDLLRNDISKVCQPGSVKVPALFAVESFPAVHHLVSTVIGEIAPQYDATDLIRAAFPGGSITGAPKIRAMEIIEELEPNRRSIYCGSIGYISTCGNMDTSITIRTLVCQKQNDEPNIIHCWAGGGIVADSQVDAEYQESFDKVNKILPVLSNL